MVKKANTLPPLEQTLIKAQPQEPMELDELWSFAPPEEQHVITDNGDGETNHIERFNTVLSQRLARFVRRTLSFSKIDTMHDNCLRLFLHEYNLLIKNRA